jgi:hypothetical protein
MKTKFILLLLGILAVSLSSCKKKAVYANFETQYSFKVTVPANALLASPLFPLSFEETSNSEDQYSLNDTRKDLVEEVHVKSFLLEIDSPATDDLSFLNSVKFYINADAEPEMLVASKDPVPADVAKDLSLDVEDVNLATYLRKDAFTIRTKVVTDENRTHDIVVKATINFNTRAKVLDLN